MNYTFDTFDKRVIENKRLHQMSRFKSFLSGEIIIGQTDCDDNVYFILDGKVKISNFSETGRDVWHNELGSGKTFGEMAAISGKPRSATVIAQTKTHVACVTRSEFLTLLRNDADIALWIMEELTDRLTLATQQIYELVSYKIPARVHSEIIKLCEGQPLHDGLIKISPIPNFSDMAKRINTDRENVSREVSILIQKGVLKKTQSALLILNLSYLENSVEK